MKMSNPKLLLPLVIAGSLTQAACGEAADDDDAGHQDATVNEEATCINGIAQLEAALAGNIEDVNARTEAEGELDETFEARDEGDWDDCLDALEEAFEALDIAWEGAGD